MTSAILIDDDPIINFVHKRVLEKLVPGIKTRIFQTAGEALEFIQAEMKNPEAEEHSIFLDINMPEINGWDFLEMYEPMGGPYPVFLLTSSLDPRDMTRAKDYPSVKCFLNKPLTGDLLKRTMVVQ